MRLTAASGRPPSLSSNLASDKQWSEAIEVECRLLRPSHHLNDRGQRVQIFSNQTDDEVVVVPIEPVTRETDIVDEICGTELHPDLAVLGQDRPLLFGWQLGEGSAAAQRIPDCPGPIR